MRRPVSAPRLIAVVLAVATAAHAEPAEVRATRDRGLVIHDGKGHYIAFGVADPASREVPLTNVLFYGDGKTFHRQPLKNSSRDTDKNQADWMIVDERLGLALDQSWLKLEKGAYSMRCRNTVTALQVLDGKEARTLLAKAVFKPVGMDREAYSVGRDGTTYYLVDRGWQDSTSPDWHVFVGKRGAMKQQKLKDLATDADALVFSTSTGSLNVAKKLDAPMVWVPKRGKPVTLADLPIDKNLALIYSDLGIYTSQFGVPCDDL